MTKFRMSVSKNIYSAKAPVGRHELHPLCRLPDQRKPWLGGRLGHNQNDVPDYAVSATNLDFENAGFQLGARYTFGEAKDQKGFTMGLSYSKYFLFDRKVANTAWDGGGLDTCFSPTEAPFNVGSDGYYRGKVDILDFDWSTRSKAAVLQHGQGFLSPSAHTRVEGPSGT